MGVTQTETIKPEFGAEKQSLKNKTTTTNCSLPNSQGRQEGSRKWEIRSYGRRGNKPRIVGWDGEMGLSELRVQALIPSQCQSLPY